MQRDNLGYAAAAAICAAALLLPSGTRAGTPSLQMSVSGEGDRCADLKVQSDGAIARAEEAFTQLKTQPLAIDGTTRAGIRVRGWDGPGYSVQACKIAVAEDRAAAEGVLKEISVKQSSGRFSASGPATGKWTVYYLVRTPRDADLDLETSNGPVSLDGVAGRIKVRAANGPVSIHECSGEIQARAANGPISFSGAGGDVSLAAQNGPLSLRLSGSDWQGPKLEARTVNGPLSLHVPDAYRSGIRIETGPHAPLSCRAGICSGATSEVSGGQRSLQLNGANPLVRLSTGNGPVAVRSDSRGPLMI